jgi:peroxiredoxin
MAPKRLWIDQSRFLVLADSLTLDRRSPVLPDPVHIAQMASLTSLAWNTTPADSLFAFQVPAGAQRVERLGATPAGRGAKGASAGGDDGPDPMVGRAAPAFSLHDLTGVKRSLADLKGKVVLLDFWATWCEPCREALPHIRNVSRKFQGQPLVILSVSLDSDEKKWKEFIEKNEMTWPQYRDGGFTGPIAKMFSVTAIPHTFTIDADGVLQEEHVGDASIEGKLKKLLAQVKDGQSSDKTSR